MYTEVWHSLLLVYIDFSHTFRHTDCSARKNAAHKQPMRSGICATDWNVLRLRRACDCVELTSNSVARHRLHLQTHYLCVSHVSHRLHSC